MAAVTRALSIDPYFYPALLHKFVVAPNELGVINQVLCTLYAARSFRRHACRTR